MVMHPTQHNYNYKIMWNERYSEAGFAYGTEPNDFLFENFSKLTKGKVLCLPKVLASEVKGEYGLKFLFARLQGGFDV
ncbi:MAG: hypothetical protein RLZZ535_2619 [Cyanobacteriota bacterium]|jgi:hypothetical protein